MALNGGEHNFGREFVCVEYPAVVMNDTLMLKTLGGLQNISTAYSKKNRRLELRLRPNDAFSKPACGAMHKVSAMLLKMKLNKKRCSDGTVQIEVIPVVLGQIHSSYRFKNLCDFQFLPMHRNGDQNVCEYDQMVPSGMPKSDWLLGDTPLFLTPPAFSRMDTMQSYLYRKEASDEYDTAPHNIIGRTRRRRSGHAVFVSFEVPDTPRAPREIALQLLSLKFLSEKHLEKIHKLFEERPVWSKNALRYLTRFSNDQLKYLLPAVAYYFVTGPWRVMWVRFGYDPRTQPEARMYQTLDYRLRAKGGLRTKVKAKRSYCDYLLPYKSTPSCKPKMAVIGTGEDVPEFPDSGDDKGHLEENMYIFRPGMMPPSRQMFYQYCDVLVPEIQDMLEKLPEPQSQCHEKLGWMPPRFDDRCREILNAEILKSFHTELSGGTISTEMMVADDSP